jgi:hypothetical protein
MTFIGISVIFLASYCMEVIAYLPTNFAHFFCAFDTFHMYNYTPKKK